MPVTLLYALVSAGVLMVGVRAWWRVVGTWRRYRGKMLVTCPETRRTVGVDVDARHVALSRPGWEGHLRLKDCTRWPERAACGQTCVHQIGEAPEGCLVRERLTGWYLARTCAFCGKPFRRVGSYDHHPVFWYDMNPALLTPDGRVLEWHEVAVENLPDVLRTHEPVCWDCAVVEDMKHRHPELLTQRPGR